MGQDSCRHENADFRCKFRYFDEIDLEPEDKALAQSSCTLNELKAGL